MRAHNFKQVNIGDQFGRWTILNDVPDMRIDGKHYRAYYHVRCSCGSEGWKYIDNLRRVLSSSCGCLLQEVRKVSSVTHGMSKTRVYAIWNMMQQRINLPSSFGYPWYGGRGLDMDPRWLKFEAFISDMGMPPEGFTIERIDNDRGYWPDNCVWASRTQQARNTSRTVRFSAFGENLTIGEWAEKTGIKASTISSRMYTYGWSVEEAVSTPVYATRTSTVAKVLDGEAIAA